ncbi:TPA: exonuclease SbcCD subunit D [Candidatus Dependentiae bacterium]|nr:MAG: Nuclease SbcCD, D subunit [candidate division TM6 bacterium GW2011_GWF2_36_131]KKQ03495.1 MAG: Nuclease SbcCD, D subunit [candidate division TM6 bacterium GW2011_GWE2_36_25]KKQ20231.1 MAG: Nuclease SbcCD, D subunit [candidate division TM6 bacterium GW2011_GWA2_36_9]HBR70770.1 exonuclease SbcCD subunit D [Candidatus Dependentiae bacterium]HCU00155.1 exonuclease SbcCD subunit D [Candidatus Dependentiae bacterium]
MIRFIHTADLHFGVENYGKIDQKTGINSRLLDFEKAFNFCIETAINENVDFFLFCGDAYKTAHPSPTQQKLLLRSFLKLHHAQIPVIIIVGNHDHPLSFGKAHALDIFSSLPMNGFYVFNKPNLIKIDTKSGPVQIVGIPWPVRSTLTLNTIEQNSKIITQKISTQIGSLINSFAQELDENIPAVLAAHLTASNGIFSGSEKRAIYGSDPIFLPSQLALPQFDYVALGHLHRYQSLNKDQTPPIIYSGSIERIDFGERREEKGFCLVTIKEKGQTTYQFIKTPTRPCLQLEIHLNDKENQTEQILYAIKEKNIKDAIIKVVYHIPPTKTDHVDLKSIQRACATAHYLVGIFPVKTIVMRERRTTVKLDMNFETLLEEYFKQKNDLKNKSEHLINKIKMLMQEMEQADQV